MIELASPSWSVVPVFAAVVDAKPIEWVFVGAGVALFFVALALFLLMTRAGIIARAATKEAIRQPVFMLVMLVAMVAMVINTFTPFFSLGEDVKMLKDCGLATILISGLLLAVWTASTSISDEIEGKTAMTLLSKPINRRQFVVGKYVGILTAVLLLIIPVTVLFLGLIDYKVFYDGRESSRDDITHALALRETVQVLPGIVLIFFEIAVLAAVSVAISTRLPMVVNMVTCFTIFVIGHLTPTLLHSSATQGSMVQSGPVLFMARVFAAILPSLDTYNIQAAIATGSLVPPTYLGWSAIYTLAYCLTAILLAFILFEDRDLA